METTTARLTRRDHRRFGVVVGGVFLALGSTMALRPGGTPLAATFTVLGTALILAGLAAPSALGPVHRAWMTVGKAISRITTPIVMTLIYFLVLTPTGWIMRLAGRRPLKRRPRQGSCWVDRSERRSDLTRQF